MSQNEDENFLIENNVSVEEADSSKSVINSHDIADAVETVQVSSQAEKLSTPENIKQKSKSSAKNSHSDMKQMNVKKYLIVNFLFFFKITWFNPEKLLNSKENAIQNFWIN